MNKKEWIQKNREMEHCVKNDRKVSLYIPQDLYEELSQIHAESGERVNTIILRAIQTGLRQATEERNHQSPESGQGE